MARVESNPIIFLTFYELPITTSDYIKS